MRRHGLGGFSWKDARWSTAPALQSTRRMKTKIHGETPIHGETSLCVTCHHSTIIRGQRLDEEIVDCTASLMQGRRIPFKVTACSSYSDARRPSYGELVRMAWILTPHSKRRPAGFIRASQLEPSELREILCGDPDNAE